MEKELNILETYDLMTHRKKLDKELKDIGHKSLHNKALTSWQYIWTGVLIWGVLVGIGFSLSLWVNGWKAVLDIHYVILAGTLHNFPLILALMALTGCYNLLRIRWNKRKGKKAGAVTNRIIALDQMLTNSVVPSHLLDQSYLGQMVKMKKEAGMSDQEIVLLFENSDENDKLAKNAKRNRNDNILYLHAVK